MQPRVNNAKAADSGSQGSGFVIPWPKDISSLANMMGKEMDEQ